jgi:hypothetical protein
MQVFSKLIILLITSLSVKGSVAQAPDNSAFIKIRFNHSSGGSPLVLRDSVYTTPLGDTFTLNKLKYYTSNFLLDGKPVVEGDDNYQLIDLARQTEYIIPVPAGNYSAFGFTLGIDSARNCSGAQTGALDPMNDMFWTWNSGYVMFKLDGTSPSSNADRNRIEHHVGGYRFDQNVAKLLNFDLGKPIALNKKDTVFLTFDLNLDKYWSSSNNISLKEDPVCTLPGALALRISDNFMHLFTLTGVKENEK